MQHARSLRRFVLLAVSLLSACAAADPAAQTDATAKAPHGAAAAFLTARFAARQNDLDFAADQFIKAMASDPDNPELQQQAFLAALMAGRPEAVQLAAGLRENQAAQLLLANNDAKAGRWDRAEARFATMPRQGLMQILAPLAVAWSQAGQSHFDEAQATLRPFVESPRMRAVFSLHAALIADFGHRDAEAARLYHTAQVEYPGSNLELGRMLASWQARQGQMAEAQASLAAMIDSSPDLAIALPRLQAAVGQPQIRSAADGLAQSYLALAAALRAQDANEFAAVLLRLALDMRPDLVPARLLSAELLDIEKHPDAALRILAPVAVNEPLAGLVRLRQAVLLAHSGDTEAALRALDKLSADFPTRPEPPAVAGDLLRSVRRYPEAVVAYDKAVALLGTPKRTNWPLFYDRGIALDRAHQWPRAEADFNTALELSPEQPVVLNYLGYSWTEQGRNLPRARQMIERAAEQRPNDGAIIDSLGWVVLRQGNTGAAVKYLERAVELDPEDPSINGHLGDAYWAAGRKLEAQFQWRRSLNLNPEPEDLVKLQAKLREGEQAMRGPVPATAAQGQAAEKTVR